MLEKFLKEVVSVIVGKHAEEIAVLINTKKHVNEFTIAKKLDITINQTRNILYKILDHGLVSFVRKKDKRKGWYTYFWRFEVLKSLEFLKGIILRKTEQISRQVKSRETKEFYICERCNIEFNEENALIHNFTCNECGGIFTLKDNTKVLREFKRILNKLDRDLKLVEEEIIKEKEKLEKEKLRKIKKEKAKTPTKQKVKKTNISKKVSKKKDSLVSKTKKKELSKKSANKKVSKKKIVKKKSVKKKTIKKKIVKKK